MGWIRIGKKKRLYEILFDVHHGRGDRFLGGQGGSGVAVHLVARTRRRRVERVDGTNVVEASAGNLRGVGEGGGEGMVVKRWW